MALAFNNKPVATIKAKAADGTEIITISGVTTAATTPENAATQINKILDIGGRAIVADENMTRIRTEEAVNE